MRRAILSIACVSCLYVEPVRGQNYYCDEESFACNVSVSMTAADIESCWGTALPESLDDCVSQMTEELCTVSLDEGWSAYPTPEYCCEFYEAHATECCENGDWNLGTQGLVDLDEYLDAMRGSCSFPIDVEVSCVKLPGVTLTSDTECLIPGEKAFTDDADFELTIDPLYSYVTLVLADQSIQSPLDGWAYAATNPKRALAGFAEADSFSHDGVSYVENYMYLLAEFQLGGTNGAFTVPVNQLFDLRLYGSTSTEDYGYRFAPQVSSGGTFDTLAEHWTYEYSQTSVEMDIAVHLEGSLLPLSSQ